MTAARRKHREKPVARTRSDGEATRKKILQEAERLFAETGYDGISIRQITSACDVELSAVNYHFKTKEKLFHAVLAMRVDEMNAKRLRLINAVEITPDCEESLRALLDAFCRPFTGESETPDELSNYRRLLALVINSKRWQSTVFEQHYDPIVQLLIQSIRQIVAPRNDADVIWYVSFFLGALANAFAETGRVDRLSRGLCDSSDLGRVKEKLIDFTVNALMGLKSR